MNSALVIMAAGIGSRFGGGIKQLEPVGPNGEIIMDYSIHDAIAAGFNKIIFIIRKVSLWGISSYSVLPSDTADIAASSSYSYPLTCGGAR